jgi:hypothetical protein
LNEEEPKKTSSPLSSRPYGGQPNTSSSALMLPCGQRPTYATAAALSLRQISSGQIPAAAQDRAAQADDPDAVPFLA